MMSWKKLNSIGMPISHIRRVGSGVGVAYFGVAAQSCGGLMLVWGQGEDKMFKG